MAIIIPEKMVLILKRDTEKIFSGSVQVEYLKHTAEVLMYSSSVTIADVVRSIVLYSDALQQAPLELI